MWLTAMRRPERTSLIDGRCTSLTALSDFVSALEMSKLFARPVEIVDSQVDPATAGSAGAHQLLGAGRKVLECGHS